MVERKEGVGLEAFFMGNRPSACSLCAAIVELNVLIVVMVCRWLGCISATRAAWKNGSLSPTGTICGSLQILHSMF